MAPHIPCRIQPAHHKLLSFMWLMGNTESFRSVADRFGESRGSLHLYITQVVEAFQTIGTNYIKWPDTEMDLRSVSDEFEKMPGVVGCVDGTYVPMTGKSGEKRNAYICRKGFPAMHAQITCTNNLTITDITTGYPGSVHDARVFRNSPYFRSCRIYLQLIMYLLTPLTLWKLTYSLCLKTMENLLKFKKDTTTSIHHQGAVLSAASAY